MEGIKKMAGGGMVPVKLEGIITDDFGGELKRWSQMYSYFRIKEVFGLII